MSHDWISFSFRKDRINICDTLSTSIKKWKKEYFFVDAIAFAGPIKFANLADREFDPTLELNSKENLVIE